MSTQFVVARAVSRLVCLVRCPSRMLAPLYRGPDEPQRPRGSLHFFSSLCSFARTHSRPQSESTRWWKAMWKSDANTSTTAANGSSWSSPNASRLSWQQGVAKSWQGIAHAPAHYLKFLQQFLHLGAVIRMIRQLRIRECCGFGAEWAQLGRSHVTIWCNMCFACSSQLVMLRARVYAAMPGVHWV